MSDAPDWILLDAYLAGTASDDQRAAVVRWLAESPEREQLLGALRAGALADATTWDVDGAWARVASTMDRKPVPRRSTPATSRLPISHHGIWRIAAVLVVAAGAGVVGRAALRSTSAASSPIQEVATRAGQRVVVTLRDSSRVTLNAGSRLRYDTAAGASRDVWLDGEAYFDVRHDEHRPFRVHARGGVAEDVGTRFVVRAYAEEPHVDVAVAEGAVRVARATDAAAARLVTAGMLARVPATGALLVSALPTEDRYFAWTHGVLSLDGQTLSDAIPTLEHWYGVQIRVADPVLRGKRVFGTFERATLSEMCAALALAIDASYSQSGSSVTFVPRRQ